ncbi:MAG: AAA family ATPase [Sandaracinaceae bacterium]
MPFVGRIEESAALREATRRAHLAIVHGPAGVGKTRLVEVALGPAAILVALDGAADAAALRQRVLRSLGIDAMPDRQADRSIARALEHRRERVLVLDGADRVLDALPATIAAWRGPNAQHGARLVVTACRAPTIEDAAAVEVLPLPLDDARALYRAAMREAGAPTELAMDAALERLDRSPHAILWLAARAAMIGEPAALAHLERSMGEAAIRDALEASLDGLEPAAREAAHLLAAFEAGAPPELLERECGDLEPVHALARAALVRSIRGVGGTRIAIYHAVARRVRERARDEGRWDRDRATHARLVLDATDPRTAREASGTLGALADQRAELEAIRDRASGDDPPLALRAQLALVPLSTRDGTARQARDTIAGLLARVDPTSPVVGSALVALATLERRLGDAASARAHADAAIAKDGPHRFEAQIERANLDRLASRTDDAVARLQNILSHARAAKAPLEEAIAEGELGRALQSRGATREAQRHHAQAIALARDLGLRHREALERSLHARATHRAGHPEEAIPLHEAALAMHAELGDARLAAVERGHLGYCLHEIGRLDRAEEELRASCDGLAVAGDVVLEAIERALLARVLVDRGRVAEAGLELALAERLVRDLDAPRITRTLALVRGLAHLADARYAEAAQTLGEAGDDVFFEVGFEALLPAYRAAARALSGERDAGPDLDRSAAALQTIDDPALGVALAVVRAAIEGGEAPSVPPALRDRSSDVRRAMELARALVARRDEARPARALRISADGCTARVGDGDAVDLSRRKAPRRLLLALSEARVASPGRVLDRDALIASGWPGEKMSAQAAEKRLRTAVWTLRKLGLEDVVLTRDEGYLIDPRVEVRWE